MLYRDEELRVQLQVMTPTNRVLLASKEKEYYFIDGVDQVFRSEDELMHYYQALSTKAAPAPPLRTTAWRKLAYTLNLL